MLTVTIANFIAIILAASGRLFRKEKTMLLVAAIVLTLFYSVRTDYGNDIPAYRYLFDMLSSASFSDLFGIQERTEPGWMILNYLFVPLGWQSFITFLTIIQFGTVYWLINKYSDTKYMWIVFALYVLSSELMLVSLSMLRQALAMHIVAWSIPLILNRRVIISFLIILLATTMHTSAYAAFPLIVLPYLCGLRKTFLTVSFIIVFVSFMIAEALVDDILNMVLESDTFERYSIYADNEHAFGSGLSVMLYFVSAVWLLYWHHGSKTNTFFILNNAIAVSLIPFVYSIPLVARVSYYFKLYSLVILPLLFFKKGDFVGKFIFCVIVYIIVSGYFNFFEDPVWKQAFSTYYTIFD